MKYNRRKARELAVQALYQWEHNVGDSINVREQFVSRANPKKVDLNYFNESFNNTVKHLEDIDKIIQNNSSIDLKEINPVELAILRLASYELKFNLEIPSPIIINEALDITKKFGAEEGFRFVNGVLDNMAKNLRPNGI
ncbi:MAG: transcription antitermination factor NusB [Gammaproteobacteria bacterium]|nr:transcription antitermination factor NusB [Gammaproteobacteria bacterium]